MVLLDDGVEILALAQLDGKARTSIEAVDSRSVESAFVNGDLPR